jgi:hypothetical protein
MPLTTEQLPDGSIRVCLTEDGFTACTTVASAHLIESKWPQLQQSIAKQATEAYRAT